MVSIGPPTFTAVSSPAMCCLTWSAPWMRFAARYAPAAIVSGSRPARDGCCTGHLLHRSVPVFNTVAYLEAPHDMNETAYEVLGRGYARVRQADPRFERAIREALGDAESVVNVGAGAGSYEPRDRWGLGVEPSDVMIAQRPVGAAPVIKAQAEQLPLADNMVDAALAVLTIHHWSDLEAGLSELARVARRRVVILTMDVDQLARLWIVRDYFPEMVATHAAQFPPVARLLEVLPRASARVLPVPRDCRDGFMAALWARPEAYLDPAIRAATSPWYELPAGLVEERLRLLSADLDSGRWHRRYGPLLRHDELDVGLRLITSEVAA